MPNDQPDYTSVVARPQTQLAGSPWSVVAGANTKTFTLATDTSIVGLLVPSAGGISSLTVTGHTSGITYLSLDPQQVLTPDVYYAIVQSAVDTQIDVAATSTGNFTIYVSSIPDPIAAAQVIQNPAPWQAPNQMPHHIGFGNPGPNTTVALLSAPGAGLSLWLHTVSFNCSATDANLFLWLQTSNSFVFAGDIRHLDTGRGWFDFKGVRLGTNLALQFIQPTSSTTVANTVFYEGTITYSIA